MRASGFFLLCWIVLGFPVAAQEGPVVGLRVGSHPNFGRVVLDWPTPAPYVAEENGNRLTLRFTDAARFDLSAAARPPRNLLAVTAVEGGVALQALPGTRFRHYRLGNRLVIDVLDGAARDAGASAPPAAPPAPPAVPPPAARTTPPPAPRPPPAPPAAREAMPAPAPNPPSQATPPPPTPASSAAAAPSPPPSASDAVAVAERAADPAAPAPAPAAAALREAPPAALRETSPPTPPSRPLVVVPPTRMVPVALTGDGRGIALDLGPDTAAALFRHGDWVMAVFDRAEALNLAALRDSDIFRHLETRQTGDATILQLRLAQPGTLRPRREGSAWILEAFRDGVEARQSIAALTPELDQGPPIRLIMRAAKPGRSITVLDPEAGTPLLVGTMREAGQAIAIARRQPEFQLLPAMLGVAVLPRGDNIQLRSLNDRFILQAAGMDSLRLGLDGAREPLAEAATMSRVMDLPVANTMSLQERLRTASANIASAGPLARAEARRHAAETLLALGMPQEAHAMATVALQEDPRAGADARLVMAAAAAALLAGREAEARPLENPQMPQTDETTLWRGLLAAARGDHATAGPAIAASLPLLFSYPRPLARRLMPVALEALAAAGELTAASRLAEMEPDDASLFLARGMMAEADGRIDDALAAYGAAVAGRDRLRRARAMRRSVELRLATGRLDAAGAIAELEAGLFAWRGDAEEVAARIRLAELQREAGNGRAAFELLQETQRFFPDQAVALRSPLRAAFAVALRTAPALNAASFYDAHPDFLPEDEDGLRSVLVLAERLQGLDLSDRASAVLRDALGRMTDPAARQAISTRLAAIRLAEADAAGALAALAAAPEGDDPPERVILRARALARGGNHQGADALLTNLGDAGAESLAEIRAQAENWSGASTAMARHIRVSVPPPPEALSPTARRDLARAAAFAAMAGDSATLAALRQGYGQRMEGGPLAEAFVLLTSESPRGIEDLPRLQREIAALRLLPQRLEALRSPPPTPR